MALMAIWVLPVAVSTIRDGVLFDNDDAMRLVQIREWMAGKPWYDLTQRRVDPPDSPVSHWSRIIEPPIAGAILALRTAFDPVTGERIAVAVWPMLLLALFTFLLFHHAQRLVAAPALLLGAVTLAFNPLLLFQLLPGRIDHHGVQMLLSLLLLILTTSAMAQQTRAAGAAGMVAALMLSIGLETLPLIATAAAAFGMAWIISGGWSRRSAMAFGGTLALGAPILFALSVPPTLWTSAVCDQLSLPWLWLAVAGGGALFALAAIRQPERRSVRAALAFGAAAVVCGVFFLAWPGCLRGPYAFVDPLVRSLWLSDVGEARPLLELAFGNPTGFLFFAAFLIVGWAALAGAVLSKRRSADILVLFAFSSTALVVALSEMRAAPFAAIFAFFGWLLLIDRALAIFASRNRSPARAIVGGVAVAAVFLASLPFGWNATARGLAPPSHEATDHGGCRTPADLDSLAAEPAALVLAPIRLGPRILAATDHSVFAAPYHRNNHGNRTALEMLTVDSMKAEAMLRQLGVGYVAFCLDDPDLPKLKRQGEGSNLLRSLAEGAVPAWLEPLETDGPIRVWRIR